VYQAEITDGSPAADGDEIGQVAWFTAAELPGLELNRFTRALLSATWPR